MWTFSVYMNYVTLYCTIWVVVGFVYIPKVSFPSSSSFFSSSVFEIFKSKKLSILSFSNSIVNFTFFKKTKLVGSKVFVNMYQNRFKLTLRMSIFVCNYLKTAEKKKNCQY